LCTQIYGQGFIPNPPCLSTFNSQGEGSKIRCASLNGLDWGSQIYGQVWILDPLFSSTFNRGGGGARIGGLKSPPPVTSLISSTIHLPPSIFHSISHLHSVPSWHTLSPFDPSCILTPVPLPSMSSCHKRHVLPQAVISHHLYSFRL